MGWFVCEITISFCLYILPCNQLHVPSVACAISCMWQITHSRPELGGNKRQVILIRMSCGSRIFSHLNTLFCSSTFAWLLATWLRTRYDLAAYILFSSKEIQIEFCFSSCSRLYISSLSSTMQYNVDKKTVVSSTDYKQYYWMRFLWSWSGILQGQGKGY